MVIIRLARRGCKKRPFYNIIVTDSRSPRDSNFIERIGFYNPISTNNEKGFYISNDRFSYWRNVGAGLSKTVCRLLKNNR